MQLFGTQVAKSGRSQVNLFSMVKRALTLQDVQFWLICYVISFLMYQLFSIHLAHINIINLILFPFSVILIGNIVNQLFSGTPLLLQLFYPSYKNLSNSNVLVYIILGFVKLWIYINVWRYSFIIGLVGLIFTLHYARKLIK